MVNLHDKAFSRAYSTKGRLREVSGDASRDKERELLERWNRIDVCGTVQRYRRMQHTKAGTRKKHASIGPIVFDFDAHGDTQAKREAGLPEVCDHAVALRNYLDTVCGLEHGAFRFYLTGGFGVHAEIHPQVINLTAPVFGFPRRCRRVAEQIAREHKLTLDFRVYSERRMWRLAGAEHGKTGLYKVEIDPWDLESYQSPEAYRNACKQPQAEEPYIWAPEILVVPHLAAWASVSKSPAQQVKEPLDHFQRLPCLKSLLRESNIDHRYNMLKMFLIQLFRQNLGMEWAEIPQAMRAYLCESIKSTAEKRAERITEAQQAVDHFERNGFRGDFRKNGQCKRYLVKQLTGLASCDSACLFHPDNQGPVQEALVTARQLKLSGIAANESQARAMHKMLDVITCYRRQGKTEITSSEILRYTGDKVKDAGTLRSYMQAFRDGGLLDYVPHRGRGRGYEIRSLRPTRTWN